MKKFSIKVRVYYEDTDAGGIVYHANYLRFMERARTDWVRQFGVSQQSLLEQRLAFVVKDMKIDFAKSAKLDDELLVTCEPTRVANASLVMAQSIYNNNHVVVTAIIKIACIDTHTNRPRRIPPTILREMRSES